MQFTELPLWSFFSSPKGTQRYELKIPTVSIGARKYNCVSFYARKMEFWMFGGDNRCLPVRYEPEDKWAKRLGDELVSRGISQHHIIAWVLK